MGASTSTLSVLVLLICAVVVVFPCWRIIARTGLPGVLGILAIVPLVNLILLWVLAFIDWPALKKAGSDNV
jgi:hypothetical protein